jgi:hypothetical protein
MVFTTQEKPKVVAIAIFPCKARCLSHHQKFQKLNVTYLDLLVLNIYILYIYIYIGKDRAGDGGRNGSRPEKSGTTKDECGVQEGLMRYG